MYMIHAHGGHLYRLCIRRHEYLQLCIIIGGLQCMVLLLTCLVFHMHMHVASYYRYTYTLTAGPAVCIADSASCVPVMGLCVMVSTHIFVPGILWIYLDQTCRRCKSAKIGEGNRTEYELHILLVVRQNVLQCKTFDLPSRRACHTPRAPANALMMWCSSILFCCCALRPERSWSDCSQWVATALFAAAGRRWVPRIIFTTKRLVFMWNT